MSCFVHKPKGILLDAIEAQRKQNICIKEARI